MLKIYGANLSSPANKVRFVANYLKIPYEYIQVKIREGEHQKTEYTKINPVGKIPAIDDEGFTLFESSAICKYLSKKAESKIYPADVKAQAIVDQWVFFSDIHIQGAVGRILFNKVFAPIIGEEVDVKSLECGQKFLKRFLPVIEKQLSGAAYLAGKAFSLADITLLAALDPLEVVGVDIAGYTSTNKWRAALKAQSFYTQCHKDYGEAIQRMTTKT